jgi:hypothetical protein
MLEVRPDCEACGRDLTPVRLKALVARFPPSGVRRYQGQG